MSIDEDERVKWEHRMLNMMIGLCAGMILLCAGAVWHIFGK